MSHLNGGNGKNGNYTAAQFIAAIPGTGGIISTVASRVGCEWHTAKRYITGYATVAQAYADECAKVTDLAESVIIGSIKDKDVQTAKWYLTMKGRERGYVQSERHEVEMDGTLRIEYVHDWRVTANDEE